MLCGATAVAVHLDTAREGAAAGDLRHGRAERRVALASNESARGASSPAQDYSQAKQNIQQLMRDGIFYKRSATKTDESLEFLPVNLHVQRMWAQNDALQRRGVLDIITVGAFTRHDVKGRKCGGLIK